MAFCQAAYDAHVSDEVQAATTYVVDRESENGRHHFIILDRLCHRRHFQAIVAVQKQLDHLSSKRQTTE